MSFSHPWGSDHHYGGIDGFSFPQPWGRDSSFVGLDDMEFPQRCIPGPRFMGLDIDETSEPTPHVSVSYHDGRLSVQANTWQGVVGVLGASMIKDALSTNRSTKAAQPQAEAAQPQAEAAKPQAKEAAHAQRQAELNLEDECNPQAPDNELDVDITPENVKAAQRETNYMQGKSNIVVTGSQGVGKSSPVNALRGKANNEDGAAAVGETETTSSMAQYVDEHHPMLWTDTPGAGTKLVTAWQFCMTQKLYAYDTVVIVHNSAPKEIDRRIFQMCQKQGQKCVIVCSKADQDIRKCQQRLGDDTTEEDAREYYLAQVAPARAGNWQQDISAADREFKSLYVSAGTLRKLRQHQHTPVGPINAPIDEIVLLKELELFST